MRDKKDHAKDCPRKETILSLYFKTLHNSFFRKISFKIIYKFYFKICITNIKKTYCLWPQVLCMKN